MTKRTWGDDIFAGFSPKPAPPDKWKDATHMTNANALPIQDRLRDQRWDKTQYYPFEYAFIHQAADRIDALEKALREIDDVAQAARHHPHVVKIRGITRAALGEGE